MKKYQVIKARNGFKLFYNNDQTLCFMSVFFYSITKPHPISRFYKDLRIKYNIKEFCDSKSVFESLISGFLL